MKKAIIITFALMLSVNTFTQVFNTASTLKPGKFSVGLNPCLFDRDLGLFLHGGVGLVSGIDLAMRYGILEGYDYFGADLEWRLLAGKPNISLVTGGHVSHDFGLDALLNVSFPITGNADMYTGFDTDLNFGDDDTELCAWIPIGVELALRSKIAFMMEAEIPLSSPSYFVFGGGVAFYF